jgi:tetraacyldisaccharide 4'-kinase
MSFSDYLWYQSSSLAKCLLPVSWVYKKAIHLRRYAYQREIFTVTKFPVPVWIVGNISVGGTGKTPFVAWLVRWLKTQGYQPGIVSRGYKGKSKHWPRLVTVNSDPQEVGDEAVLLVKKTECPMAVGPDRVAAVSCLLENHSCNIVISDDGLQHYALSRELELVIVDQKRGFGNGFCLPAGPLREPVSRLNEVNAMIVHGKHSTHPYSMQLQGENFLHSVSHPKQTCSFVEFQRKEIHAVAGIGHPQRFFTNLRQQGLTIIEHIFPDHHFYQKKEIDFGKDAIVIMTEKDAVKCQAIADQRHWYFAVETIVSDQLIEYLKRLLKINNKNF